MNFTLGGLIHIKDTVLGALGLGGNDKKKEVIFLFISKNENNGKTT